MKPRMYWKAQNVSKAVLVGFAGLSLLGLFTVERFKIRMRQPHYEEKIAAARIAKKAIRAIRTTRLARQLPIDSTADPTGSGLIGRRFTTVTSDTGLLSAKQTSINPNFAAVMVHYFKKAGLEKGDTVAIGLSGSFPAINVAVFSAVSALGIRPIVIASASASQWGANIPKFLWLDMETLLHKRKIFPFRSIAASIGGVDDLGAGISEEGIERLREGIQRNGVPLLHSKDRRESLQKRLELYNDAAGGQPIKAYINIGGGIVSTGTFLGKRMFKPGLNETLPPDVEGLDSVMVHFAKQQIPVIHLVNINRLARQFGLPLKPAALPEVGTGSIFEREEYNLALVLGVLMTVLAGLYLFFRSDIGPHILESIRFRR